MPLELAIFLIVLSLIFGIVLGLIGFYLIPIFKAKKALSRADKIIRDADIKAEHIIKNAELDAKQNSIEMRNEADKQIKEKKAEIAVLQNQLSQREQSIDRRDIALLAKETTLEQKAEDLARERKEVEKKNDQYQEKLDAIIVELEHVSQMSTNDARDEIFRRVESKLSKEIAAFIKNKEEEAEATVNERARDLLVLAVNRYSQEVTTEHTVSTVTLPNDEMKGRIIGREGRNIRTLEQMLGVDLIIDDTPEVITVSCFNPIRREIATRSLAVLIKDGRIQPGRIEEVVAKVQKEMDEVITKAGQDAAFQLGLPRINKALLNYVGRLKYRTSYGQNGYIHSIEVASLAGIMAAELGLDVNLAKRCGLLHDIGKSVDFEMEGSHVELGIRLAKKYGEPDEVIDSISSHHGDTESRFIYSQLVIAADTLSAARPGARREMLENYIKRLEQLESICNSYDGVQTSFAMQSGREVRVMVVPEKIDDLAAHKLSRDIRERIENEMTYPGQIKISVIREYRAQETAK
ncbi:MAG: ribonuclease Y [Bacilli bacterium]|jgi:ribonuclease Y|nr:ribonuclease Y [Bacilli bacterium]MDD3389125.1 ribonuclease Y [Bacilli bacterium]MDD4344770.1 ribonuclease Y [Bacilli bacterium]MDD4520906.1 ribonuclease Y [Bacilli bacterium]MDY0399577.1 ribonuclease Y [Bacilli bacterium]